MIADSPAGYLVTVLYVAGLAVCVLAALAALVPRQVYGRLHFLTPMTSLSAPLIVVSLTLAAVAVTVVVATGAPDRQAVTLSFFGLTLTAAFAALAAPDVALSQLGVGTAIVPLMVMLAIRTIRSQARPPRERDSGEAHR